MLPSIVIEGAKDAQEILDGAAHRAGNATPAFSLIRDDLRAAEDRWWKFTYDGKTDKEKRAGRNPALMVQTGTLRNSISRRGAKYSTSRATATYAFIGSNDPLVNIHQAFGRDSMGAPDTESVGRVVRRLNAFILTGALDG